MNKIIDAMKTFGYRYEPTKVMIHTIALSLGISIGSFLIFPLVWEWARPVYAYTWWIPYLLLGLVIFRAFWKLNKWDSDKPFNGDVE